MLKKFLVFPILFILLSIGVFSYSYASPESEAQEDINAGCRDDQTLVYRATYLDFICVEPSTADRWVQLGMAEIIKESSRTPETNTSESDETREYPGAPPPAPKPMIRNSDENSICRDGNILVYHFAYQDNICTSFATASTWERIGLVEIVKTPASTDDNKYVETHTDLSSKNIVVSIESTIIEEQESVTGEEQESVTGEEQEDVLEPENVTISEVYSDEFPKLSQMENNIWLAVDFDGTKSILVEGDSGVAVIDMLGSYESTKKIIQEFKTISDKPVKVIIFTTVNPDLMASAEAYMQEWTVEIILHEDLLESYNDDYGLDIPNAFTFPTEFLIDIHGVKMSIIVDTGRFADQIYIYLPNYDGLLLGDSQYGVVPIIFNLDYLQYFSN